jgi:hypothetical protein
MPLTFGFLSSLKAIHFGSGPYAVFYFSVFLGETGTPPDVVPIPITVTFKVNNGPVDKNGQPVYPTSQVLDTYQTLQSGEPFTDKFWFGPPKLTTLIFGEQQDYIVQQVVVLDLSAAPVTPPNVVPTPINVTLTIATIFVETLAVGLVTIKGLTTIDLEPPSPYPYEDSANLIGDNTALINYSYPGAYSNLQCTTGFPFAQVLRGNFNPKNITGTINTKTLAVTLGPP